MKKMKTLTVALLLLSAMVLGLTACGKKAEDGLWDSAKYQEDAEFGEGSKTLTVLVTVAENTAVFTIHTDAATVGEALVEHGLLEGEQGPYGLFIKAVNGIQADFDKDQAYWGFYQNGEYMMTGVDLTEFADGDQYELVYTKE